MLKKVIYPVIFISILSLLILSFKSNDGLSSNEGFAVVELFTSEGCSSCPPADALIAKIAQENKNNQVYILAYHVDYWNRLGWKDKFSDPRYSARQNQYAKWLNLSSVYTPQIVVNGSKEFIGSEEKILRNAIKTALSQKSKATLEISVKEITKKGVILDYNTNQKINNFNMVVAMINPGEASKIERGENKGRTLSHVQIVSDFKTFNLNGKTSGKINLSTNGWSKKSTEIIAFLQNIKTGEINTAVKITDKIKRS